MKSEQDLYRCAYEVADQYRAGMWPELINKEWTDVWKVLISELRGRCPGFSGKQYGLALEQGFADSR